MSDALQTIFSAVADWYGHKWHLVINLIMCAILQLGASFIQTFIQFLTVRALFSIGDGRHLGSSGCNYSWNLPVELCGLVGGVVQQGYATGYLIAAVINLTLVPLAFGQCRLENPVLDCIGHINVCCCHEDTCSWESKSMSRNMEWPLQTRPKCSGRRQGACCTSIGYYVYILGWLVSGLLGIDRQEILIHHPRF